MGEKEPRQTADTRRHKRARRPPGKREPALGLPAHRRRLLKLGDVVPAHNHSGHPQTLRARPYLRRQASSILAADLFTGLYSCRHGEQVSKNQAALWAAGEYREWSDLIQRALAWRSEWRRENVDHASTYPEVALFVSFAAAAEDRLIGFPRGIPDVPHTATTSAPSPGACNPRGSGQDLGAVGMSQSKRPSPNGSSWSVLFPN